jgi:hypothetical protein
MGVYRKPFKLEEMTMKDMLFAITTLVSCAPRRVVLIALMVLVVLALSLAIASPDVVFAGPITSGS